MPAGQGERITSDDRLGQSGEAIGRRLGDELPILRRITIGQQIERYAGCLRDLLIEFAVTDEQAFGGRGAQASEDRVERGAHS